MRYDSITEIDIHGMQPEEAVKAVARLVDGAPDTVYRIRVIHGYHRGYLQLHLFRDLQHEHPGPGDCDQSLQGDRR